MKKYILISVFFLSLGSLFSQNNAPYLFDINAGSRLMKMKNADENYACQFADLSANIGITYMFSNICNHNLFKGIGLKLDLGYDQATSKILSTDSKTKTTIFRGSGHAILDFNHFFGIDSESFGFIFHIGLGNSYMSNPADVFRKADRMHHLIVGVSPRYWINQKIAVNLDLTFIELAKQDRGVEMIDKLDPYKKEFGHYANLTLGITFAIHDTSSK